MVSDESERSPQSLDDVECPECDSRDGIEERNNGRVQAECQCGFVDSVASFRQWFEIVEDEGREAGKRQNEQVKDRMADWEAEGRVWV